MFASVHLADVGTMAAVSVLRRRPGPRSVPGLRYAATVGAAPLGERNLFPPLVGRVGLIAFWEDEAALEQFLARDRLAARLAAGWHVRLEPVNVHEYHRTGAADGPGSWPGIDDGWVTAPTPPPGPVVSLTLARTRLTQLPRTVRATLRAGRDLVGAPGLRWAVALTRPPVIATFTVWSSGEDADAYLSRSGGHRDAVATDLARPLHHGGVFIRFKPAGSSGHLDGPYGLDADLIPAAS